MPTIIFACKSNSCRSQMAEGWARNWIQEQKETIDAKLDDVKNKVCTHAFDEKTEDILDNNKIMSQISILENTVIASVALDASSVFELEEQAIAAAAAAATTSKEPTNINNYKKRKHIKGKAVEAMAKDGVDIASYIPKTFDEILPIINNDHNHNDTKEEDDGDNSPPSSTSSLSKHDFKSFQQSNSIHTKQMNNSNDGNNSNNYKPVDKLIVLCSCGDELKNQIARRSKSVEEWTIDPPTTAAKNGEGDGAYRRVSLEVRKEVTTLMERLIGDALH